MIFKKIFNAFFKLLGIVLDLIFISIPIYIIGEDLPNLLATGHQQIGLKSTLGTLLGLVLYGLMILNSARLIHKYTKLFSKEDDNQE